MDDHCPFCKLLKNPQADETYIFEFEHSAAFLNYEQEAYPGASILMFKNHCDHLHHIPIELQYAVNQEMMHLTNAILKAFGGFRANHMSLGNQVAHVHWHVIPRYPNDLNAGGMPSYMKDEERLSDHEFRERAEIIRTALKGA